MTPRKVVNARAKAVTYDQAIKGTEHARLAKKTAETAAKHRTMSEASLTYALYVSDQYPKQQTERRARAGRASKSKLGIQLAVDGIATSHPDFTAKVAWNWFRNKHEHTPYVCHERGSKWLITCDGDRMTQEVVSTGRVASITLPTFHRYWSEAKRRQILSHD